MMAFLKFPSISRILQLLPVFILLLHVLFLARPMFARLGYLGFGGILGAAGERLAVHDRGGRSGSYGSCDNRSSWEICGSCIR